MMRPVLCDHEHLKTSVFLHTTLWDLEWRMRLAEGYDPVSQGDHLKFELELAAPLSEAIFFLPTAGPLCLDTWGDERGSRAHRNACRRSRTAQHLGIKQGTTQFARRRRCRRLGRRCRTAHLAADLAG
jgi:hypothetical protein